MRRLLGSVVLVGGPLLLLRRRAALRDRIDLYFEDGSTFTLGAGAPGADQLLTVARQAL